ncbi:MAG TPA: ABC transporter ATP-binding protein [Microbacteriaceae bacterium]|nr:ABC transporter ATP-binding protein [Microbacteriaceae bacterium]
MSTPAGRRPAAGGHRGPFRGGGAPAQKARNFGPSAKRLLGTLRPDAVWLGIVVALGVVSVALSVWGPKLLGDATNVVVAGFVSRQFRNLPAGVTRGDVIAQLQHHGQANVADMLRSVQFTPGQGMDFGKLGLIVGTVTAVYILSAVFMWLQGRILNIVTQRAMHRLRMQVEDKLHTLPLRYFDRMPRGELISRVTNDVDNIGQTLQQSMSQVVISVLTVVGVLVMMFTISPLLAVIALVTVPLTLLVTVLVAKRSQKLFIAQWDATGKLTTRVEETFSGHAIVKVFGHQQDARDRFRAENDAVYRASFGAQFVSGIIMPAMMFIGNLVYVAIAVVGGIQVAGGLISIGAVQAFIQYSRQFTQPLSQLGSMANLLQSGVASAERVFELLDEPDEEPDARDSETVPDEAGHLAFEEVGFRYVADQPLIRDVSLAATPGSSVAIVGPTGAGKTTLVNLIMRFYDVDSGRITLDGVSTRQMTRADLRRRTGMVLQDTWLFSGTIRENIAYGRPGASEEEITRAATAAYVDRFVHALPDGYDTVLNDEATNLSAGERQLITIARAFLADPHILILDEATSSVDTRTELLIQRAMSALAADRTSFVIAHRLSTIRDADLILVMEHGDIVEQGTHERLLAARGAYWRLYNAQFEAPTLDAGAPAIPAGGAPAAAVLPDALGASGSVE